MKPIFYIIILFFFSPKKCIFSQSVLYSENYKWGIKENEKLIIKPVYDTIFNFDSTGKVCLGCFKTKTASANKFIKTFSVVYVCNYLNKLGEKLKIKTDEADTCSVFTLGKNSYKQYNTGSDFFTVTSKNKKYLIGKDFNQKVFKGYSEIYLSPEPSFIITENKNDVGMISTGLINFKEEQIIPNHYSGIKVNVYDSLIIACGAGTSGGGDDDIYNYEGKKISTYKRHIDMATKNFVIHKIFEPKEHYIFLNKKTKEEVIFNADELTPFKKDEVLVKIKSDWFAFNLLTKEKIPYKK